MIVINTLVCIIPRLIYAKNRQNSSASTAQSLTTCCGCDWQNIKMVTRKTGSKSAFIVLSPKCKRFTDTEAQMDINGR